MDHVYQLVLLGDKEECEESVVNQILKQTKILGIQNKFIKIIHRLNFDEYSASNPTYCLYFASSDLEKDSVFINVLIKDATLILPVIDDLNKCSELIPKSLEAINAFELDNTKLEPLINRILEGFSLLRESRRLFISYRRNESSRIAIQLYELLEKAGFDVFLDTHSIRPGEPFQEELWHRMTDSDIVILLNTPDFLGSQWTKEELAKASAMSLGVIQIIWPDCKPLSESNLFKTIQLQKKSINNQGHLTETIIKQLISDTESLRARTLAARQDNLTTEFIDICQAKEVKATLHPYKFITLTLGNTNYLIIPAVGVPYSLTSHEIYELKQQIRKEHIEEIFLLYDHTHIRKKWLKHLDWLSEHLPVKSLKLLEIEKFINDHR
ncbi:toll/interleukin-1 receptor domain-containing protein [Ignatzschineria indica]|uniref:toll/interleukin-1 receptor domain-containing protein n=1 Tax=Ignatzschineria indica TaxID=472583 RepID=UPI002578CA24|nr:toll/interleukin-1 receptor domain-containing protein [Ignatzschineria indica]MDM1545742.1 toll/interleukin-1 receptor domain-containing protein [Ignatzschineria indica]